MSSKPFIGAKEYFPGIGAIPYEGPKSDNPLAFKVYDADRKIGGKTMREHLRFAVCYWHTFCNAGADPFGPGTRHFPWESGTPMSTCEAKVDAAFEFFSKLDVPEQAEGAAFGAALQALWAVRRAEDADADLAALVAAHVRLEPRLSAHPHAEATAAYEAQYRRFLSHLEAIGPLYA